MPSDPKTAREMLAEASPRPWAPDEQREEGWDSYWVSRLIQDANGQNVGTWDNEPDGKLIVYAVNNLEHLLDRVAVLEAALEWYADGLNYNRDGAPGIGTQPGELDWGERARSALRGGKGEK